MSEAHDFLEPLWGNGLHSLCYQRRPSPFNVLNFAEVMEALITDSMRLSDALCDTWWGVHALRAAPLSGRGRSEDVEWVVSLPADIDWADEAHKGSDLLPEGAVIERLADFTPEPSIVVRSGHGFQCYWLLPEPVPAAEGLALTKALHERLEAAGLKPERFDLASVLRLPGTMNYKREPVRVELVRLDRSIVLDLVMARRDWLAPPAPPVLSTGIELPDLRPGVGDDDISPIEWVIDTYDIGTELFARGWQHHSYSAFNGHPTEFVTRPGKPVHEGHSARLFPGEGVLVFSKAAAPLKDRYYDVADVIAAYDYGGNKASMASDVRRTQMPKPALATVHALRSHDREPEPPRAPTQWPRLSEAFWGEHPLFEQIAVAADSLVVSREALVLGVLAGVLLHVPNVVVLPPPPRRAGVSLFVCLVGAPGTGKGAVMDAVLDLLPPPHGTVIHTLGTSEGLIKAFHHRDPEHEGKGAAKLVRHFNPVLIRTDEVGNFTATASSRDPRGESLLSELKQGWMGERLGKGYATEDKGMLIDPHSYRIGALMGIAPEKAEPLFGDAGGGFPQRLLFAPAAVEHPLALDERPAHPGPLRWQSAWSGVHYGVAPAFEVEVAVRRAVDAANAEQRTGLHDPLDAHAPLTKLKLAAALATLDGRRQVTMADYRMADPVMALSRATRTVLLEQIAGTHYEDERRAGARAGRIEQSRLTVREAHEQERTIKSVIEVAERIRKVVREHGEMKRKAARSSITLRHRDLFDDALQYAKEEGWVVEVELPGQGTTSKVLRPGSTEGC